MKLGGKSGGRLAAGLGIRSDEVARLRAVMASSFVLGMSLVLYYSASNAIFLTRYGIAKLPYVYIVNGLLVIAFGVGLGFLGRRVTFRTQTLAANLFMAVVILLAVLCLALPAPWNLRLGRFTLPFAAYAEVSAHPPGGLLSPWLSLLVLIAWPAATLLAERKRDLDHRRAAQLAAGQLADRQRRRRDALRKREELQTGAPGIEQLRAEAGEADRAAAVPGGQRSSSPPRCA